MENGTKRKLTNPPAAYSGDRSPSISPDGKLLAFTRSQTAWLANVFVLPLSNDLAPTSEPKQLTSGGTDITNLMWTADAREVLYIAAREGTRSLWRVPASGAGSPRPVTSIGPLGTQLAISRQGNRIAYANGYLDADIWRVNLADSHGEREPAGRLISSTRFESNPQFSPDGKRIAFTSERTGIGEIWVSNSDGSDPLQLTFLKAETGTPHWSPDGREIAFDSRVSGNAEIYAIDARGGEPRRLTKHPAADVVPSWSRDGEWIYFASKRTGVFQIWKMPVQTYEGRGEAVQITRGGGFGGFESADGRFFYYAKAEAQPTSVWKVPAHGGEEQQVVETIRTWVHFAVVEDGIYFISEVTPQDRTPIHFYSFARGLVETVAEADQRPGFGFSVSPDRRWALIAPPEFRGGDLMLVENFR